MKISECFFIHLSASARLFWLFIVPSWRPLALPAILSFHLILGGFSPPFPDSNIFLLISLLFCMFIFFLLSFLCFSFNFSSSLSFFLSFVSFSQFLPARGFLTLAFSLSPWFPCSHLQWNVGTNNFPLRTKRLNSKRINKIAGSRREVSIPEGSVYCELFPLLSGGDSCPSCSPPACQGARLSPPLA